MQTLFARAREFTRSLVLFMVKIHEHDYVSWLVQDVRIRAKGYLSSTPGLAQESTRMAIMESFLSVCPPLLASVEYTQHAQLPHQCRFLDHST